MSDYRVVIDQEGLPLDTLGTFRDMNDAWNYAVDACQNSYLDSIEAKLKPESIDYDDVEMACGFTDSQGYLNYWVEAR